LIYVSGVIFMSLWGLMNPALQGLMTRLVGPREQGQLQGANSSILGLANLVGPIVFTQIFAAFISPNSTWHQPGAPFALSGLMLIVAAIIAMRVTASLPAAVMAQAQPANTDV
jgi:DHA1 family tetracycline resistance protein-like MFS transporter